MALYVEEGETLKSLPCKRLTLTQLKVAGSELAQEILALLARGANYSQEIAKELGEHEQKVYYHMRRLEEAGVIRQAPEPPPD